MMIMKYDDNLNFKYLFSLFAIKSNQYVLSTLPYGICLTTIYTISLSVILYVYIFIIIVF